MRAIAVIAVFLLSPPSILAETTPPPFETGNDVPEPTLRAPPPFDLRLGRLRVEFERTTLRDIQLAIGKGEIAHRGDAGESASWLCYEGVANSIGVRLWLIAGEINGPMHTIAGVQVQEANSNVEPTTECPMLPSALRRIDFGRSAKMGLSKAAAIAILGKPSSESPNALSYVYLGKKPGKYNGKSVKFDELHLLELRLAKGCVVGLVAAQATTF
jgi:hypothetical protein